MKRSDVDRRAFLLSLASTGALAACSSQLGSGKLVPSAAGDGLRMGASGASKTMLSIVNKTTYADDQVFFYVWGQDAATKTFRYLQLDGSTKEWTPHVGNAFGIQLSAKGAASVKLPELVAAEIYVGLGPASEQPNFLNGQSSQQQPVAPNGWTPNAYGNNFHKLFDHVEYTYSGTTLGVNTTTVDMISLPFTLSMVVGGTTQKFGFNPIRHIKDLFAQFEKIPDFRNLLVPGASKGTYLRAIAPGHGIENERMGLSNAFPGNFLAKYIDECWTFYETNVLEIRDESNDALLATGQVGAGSFVFTDAKTKKRLTWTDPNGKVWTGFPKPDSLGVFECAANQLPSPSDSSQPVTAPVNVFGACGKNLGAAMNRGVLTKSKKQPFCIGGDYYPKNVTTNRYAQLLHEFALDSKVYGFAYDDVCGYSNYLALDRVTELEIVVNRLD